jgi:phosphoglycerate kinase
MRNIKQIKNLKGKTVIVRVDFNVPIKNGKVQDALRIEKAIPTIKFLQKHGARIILITHLGKGLSASGTGGETLLPVVKSLSKFLKFSFIPEVVGKKVTDAVKKMKDGEIILLQNVRNNRGEQACDMKFAKSLASLADIYVNDAFPVSHRKDASVVLLPKLLPAYAGLRMEEEIKKLSVTFKNNKHPFLLILGGAKFSTKIPIIKKYLKLADTIFIGGAILNDFLKARGYEVGQSLVDDTNYDIKTLLKNKKIILPEYVLVESGKKHIEKRVDKLAKIDNIIDIGSKEIPQLTSLVNKSKLILWNGPLGRYEDGGKIFTEKILKIVANANAESIIGGGDTAYLISEMKLENKFYFVSTGGGATLDFLANGTLPGIKALG